MTGRLRSGAGWLLLASGLLLAPGAATGQAPGAATAAASAAAPPPAAPAREAKPDRISPANGSVVIEITGTVRPGIVAQIRSALADVDQQRYPSGALLVLNSPGGDGLAAMEIGRIARAAGAHAFVRGRCNSACVLVLAGSVVRGVSDTARVGIHKGRITTATDVADTGAPSMPGTAEALQLAESMVGDYLREMGMPEALHRSMMAVPNDQMRFLDRAELRELGLLGFDPAYFNLRAPGGLRVYRLGPEDFEARTLQAGNACSREDIQAAAVLQCYSRVMRTGE